MSAIAAVLRGMGHQVTGSDLRDSPTLDRLRALGVDVTVGHSSDNVGEADAVTFSTAIATGNPELEVARAQGRPALRRAEILASICAVRRTIAVAGTHGKTTTSTMLALAMVEGGLQPSYIVGGEVHEIGSGAVWSDGDWLVVEADESDGTFVELGAEVAVVTSVEPDHLGHYGSFDVLVGYFERFIADAHLAVACADDETAARLGAAHSAVSYGTAPSATYRMIDMERGRSATAFTLVRAGHELGRIELPAPGIYNARNAAAAAATAMELGVDFASAARALARYTGVARRFQFRGEWNGVTLVEDYAHLPTEISSALGAAVDGDWPRVVCVFQPHRYTRTADLWRQFAPAFDLADVVVLTDIYAAGEEPIPGVTGRLVYDAVTEHAPEREVVWVERRGELAEALRGVLRPGDLCLLLGAGDLTSVPEELAASR
jgi:UDP-N-acetylmuramate--alanine ligase